jgi:2-keto-3-deoxy-L-rhamnonate aldolase RhmA
MKKNFKALIGKRPFLGTFVMISAPEVVEIVACAGMDFIGIDEEHTPFTSETAINLLRAADAYDMPAIVRIPEGTEVYIKKALDIGASGIIIPNIATAKQLEEAIRFAKFSPMGARGACPCVRANQYGAGDNCYYPNANRDTGIIALVEGVEGIRNFDEIINVANVDAIYLGPVDLSLSLGLPGDIYHPKVTSALEEMVKKTKAMGKCIGMFSMKLDDARMWLDKGVDFVLFNTDTVLFYEKYKEVVDGVGLRRD